MSKRSYLRAKLRDLNNEKQDLLYNIGDFGVNQEHYDELVRRILRTEIEIEKLDEPKLGCSCCRDMPDSINLPDWHADIWAEKQEQCENNIIDVLRQYSIYDPVYANLVLQSVSFWVRWHNDNDGHDDYNEYAHVSNRAKDLTGSEKGY